MTPRPPVTQRLYLVFTPSICRGDPWTALHAAVAGGVDLVQWRAPRTDADGARRCRALCAELGVPLIVNDHVDLAVLLDAAGAHVGQDDLPAATARGVVGAQRWLGVSTHDERQVTTAIADGADYVGFGPMHATSTKGYATGLSPGALERALRAATVPLFAIGGIALENVARLVAAGVERVAVGASILGSGDPAAAASALRSALPA